MRVDFNTQTDKHPVTLCDKLLFSNFSFLFLCKKYLPQIYPVCRAWQQCWAAWTGPASSVWPSPGTGGGTPWSGGPPARTGSCSGRTGRRSGPAAWSATPAGLAWPAWSIPAIQCRIYSKIMDLLLNVAPDYHVLW